MTNLENKKFKQLMKMLRDLDDKAASLKKEEELERIREDIADVINQLYSNKENILSYNDEQFKEMKRQALNNSDKIEYQKLELLENEAKKYRKNADLIDDLVDNGITDENYKKIKKCAGPKIKNVIFKAAVATTVAGIIVGGYKIGRIIVGADGAEEYAVTSSPNPGKDNQDYSEVDNIDSNDEQVLIEESAKNYYSDYYESFYANDETRQITEQDIINIGYLLNDREDLLSLEDFNDACTNLRFGCGYGSTNLLTITQNLEVNRKNSQEKAKNYKPAKLSRLIIKNNEKLDQIKEIEQNISNVVRSIRKNGEISKDVKQKYNNMLTKMHYDNSYNNPNSLSDATENNDNLGFKYFCLIAAYDAFGVGTTINQYKETVKSTEIKDPVTGDMYSVNLYPASNKSREILNRISRGEKGSKLRSEYTKIKNRYLIFGLNDDLCGAEVLLRKEVKYNEKIKEQNKSLTLK